MAIFYYVSTARCHHHQSIQLTKSMPSLSFLGTLAGTDTRWDVISQSVDDRTDRERGEEEHDGEWESEGEIENNNRQEFDPELVAGGVKRLFKSRYSSVSRFIGKTESEEEQRNIDALNDLDANMDEEAFQILLDGGLDRSLASHIAHLFVRDPLVIFDDAIDLDNETAMVSQTSASIDDNLIQFTELLTIAAVNNILTTLPVAA